MLPCSLSDIVCVSETVNGQVTFRFLACVIVHIYMQ